MNFAKISSASAAALILSIGMLSCTEEDVAPSVAGGNAVLTVNITREMPHEPGTRTVIEEVDGDLKCMWSANDKILVTDELGNKKGVLSIIGEEGHDTALFSGELTGINEGNNKLNFFYLGTDVENPANVSNPYVFRLNSSEPCLNEGNDEISYTYPDYPVNSLSSNDILYATRNINIVNGSGNIDRLTLSREVSFIHIELKFPDGYRYDNQPITISGTDIKNSASLNLASGALDGTTGAITVYQKDFYITLIPSANVTPKFYVNIGSLTFEGELPSRQFEAGEFVRQAHGKGVPVNLKYIIPEQTEEWIDLGLPSGNLWRNRNLGAEKESDPGYYAGWGDPDATMTSGDNTDYPLFMPGYLEGYRTYANSDLFGTSLGNSYIANIQGNINYDAAYKLTNGEGCMPAASDFTELYMNCSFEYVTVNGMSCLMFTSDINGNHIIVPLGGVMYEYDHYEYDQWFALWSDSSIYIEYAEYDEYSQQWYNYNCASVFTSNKDFYGIGASEYLAYSAKCFRANIRPIKKTSDLSTNDYQNLKISSGSSTAAKEKAVVKTTK